METEHSFESGWIFGRLALFQFVLGIPALIRPRTQQWASSSSFSRQLQTLRPENISLFGLAKTLHNDALACTLTCHHRQRRLSHTCVKVSIWFTWNEAVRAKKQVEVELGRKCQWRIAQQILTSKGWDGIRFLIFWENPFISTKKVVFVTLSFRMDSQYISYKPTTRFKYFFNWTE